MRKLLAATAVIALATSAAFAQATFEEVDGDASGGISMEEATAAGIAGDAFTGADADGDGELNADEFAALAQ